MGAAIMIFGAFGIWSLHLIRENDGLRAKLSQVTYSSKAKIDHLEAVQKEPKIKLADPVELVHEKFNSTEAPQPTAVRTPPNGAVVVSIVIPNIQTERWDVVLRDSLMNARGKVTVTNPSDKRISLVLTNLTPSNYEIHAKPRDGNDAATYRYLFTLD